MACSNILDGFSIATESLDQMIYQQAQHRSVWLNLIRRSTYPLGEGVLRTAFGIGNVEMTAADTWRTFSLGTQPLDIDDGVDQGCYNDYKDIYWGHVLKTYSPEQSQLQGPIVCVKDLSFGHNIDDFMSSYVQKIGVRAQRTWERRYRDIHIQFSKKAVAIPDFQSSWVDQEDLGSTTALDTSACELSQEMLEFVAQNLIEDGATNPDESGFISLGPSGPIFSLYIGMHQSQRLARVNNDVIIQNQREAFSGFGEDSPLVKRIGATRILGNFRHVINPLPPRYTESAGVYTEVEPFINYTAPAGMSSKGTHQSINPAWRNAPYEAALVLSPDLFTSEIVAPHNAGLDFDPRSYMGVWKFISGAYKWDTDCVDPTKQRGRHFAEFLHAPKPNPVGIFKYGWWIVFNRCRGNDVTCVECSS